MQQMDGTTHNQISENLAALKQLFPEAFSEDSIDFDKLKTLLGADINYDSEKYSFTWKGKQDAIKLALAQNTGTLRPDKASSKNWDSTENLYIEGDNLEVLRVMQESYRGKVKMIYIDPPYNTGKDFVYKDNFHDNVASYKEMMGENMRSNPETSGRYHTDWLNMMYPRLKLARNILSDDGVIFMSIDDNEIHNLRKISDEVFGEDNFIAIIDWHKKTQPSFLSKEISNVKEYLLLYKKSSEIITTKGGLTDVNKLVEMINVSNNNASRTLRKENVIIKNDSFNGELQKGLYGNGALKIELLNDVFIKSGKPNEDIQLNGRFKWTQEKMNASFDEGDTYYIKSTDSLRPTVDKTNKVANVKPLLDLFSKKLSDDIATNTDATNEMKDLFNGISPMDYPKPSKLIKYITDSITYNEKDAIVLDFFSGSGTTAHAVMKLNAEDGGNRRFICVQIPEETDEKSEAYKAGYKNICEIGKERIRRAGEKVLEDNADEIAKRESPLDVGFKVFALDTTNLKKWETSVEADTQEGIQLELEERLQDMNNPVKEDREALDMIYEVMLKNGMDLSFPIEVFETGGKEAYSIASDYLIACLDEELTLEVVKNIIARSPKVVVFYDSSFADDVVKLNAISQLERENIQVRVI